MARFELLLSAVPHLAVGDLVIANLPISTPVVSKTHQRLACGLSSNCVATVTGRSRITDSAHLASTLKS